MPRVKLKIKPSHEQFERFSRRYPNDEFRILSSYDTEDGLCVLMEADTSSAEAIIQDFEEASEVRSYEVLNVSEQTLLIQHVIQEPLPRQMLHSAGIAPKFPLAIRNGWVIVESFTAQEQLSQLKAGLETNGVPYEVISVTPLVDPTNLLTDRQWRVVTEAVTRGYYDTPRECSLTELAATLGISKSTASDILHRAEGHIIKEFVAAAETETE
ncbi:helix-turn-helix domain-containing protein [Natrinema soli]|uniref:Helix-turn-helix domain-containing protein n=1 Tax=Natrinema soli TaxID=1930624 RepID=A0ABD5SNN1_9EURY|nr:helix-turn-helix domain-containing protein [Natrinema soli]